MDYLNTHLLSLILFTPALAALVMLFLPDDAKLQRWFAFAASLIPFALTLVLWNRFDPNAAGFQFEERYVWYEAIRSSLHLGVDGIS
ncbi:MAG: NADH-quinone oxidoreductase subunit M, partial [Anaerolineales bacterium]|nr:NADH-quinone oxidoreductase subunit M [Anaerolineales bacterium]